MQMVKTTLMSMNCLPQGNYAMPLMLRELESRREMVPAKKMTHGFQVGESLEPKVLFF